jgi:dihydrofolate reductase
MKRNVIVYIACTVDGYIAGPNDDLSFLQSVEQPGEDYGYENFVAGVDTVILGRKTFDKVKSFNIGNPHAGRQTYVITSTPKPAEPEITFYTEGPEKLIQQLQSEPGKNIFVDGGAQLIHSLLQLNLIDEWIVSIIPVMIGDGVKLFSNHKQSNSLTLVSTKSFPKGLVQLHYRKTNL